MTYQTDSTRSSSVSEDESFNKLPSNILLFNRANTRLEEFSFVFLKRVIAFWRPSYCVLNGNILFFYKSESSYNKLGKYESLDLSLAYEVKPTIHVDNGITISTHHGPHHLVSKAFNKIFSIN